MRFALAILSMAAVASAQVEFKQENTEANLKSYYETLFNAIDTRKENKEAKDKISVAMTKSVFGDEARLRKAFKDDVNKEFLDRVVAQHAAALKVEDSQQVIVFWPEEKLKTVRVHAATTEELAKYEKDSVPYKEFPSGAKKLAESVLRPGMKFYEVEFTEPDKESGKKFHLFFWDGERWTMLGPAWRVLPAPDPKKEPEPPKK